MSNKFFVILAMFSISAPLALAAPITVDSTGILAPNPSNLAITEVGNTGLVSSRILLAAAHNAGTGGVVDFQQQNQGGTFPNSTLPDNGPDFANGILNSVFITSSSTSGAGGLIATGTPITSFFRLESTGDLNNNGINNFDSNLNQGGNVISGGFTSRYPGAVSGSNPLGDGSAVTGVNAAYAPNITTSIGGAYLGINNLGAPATLVFADPLSFFGITALPRGATRDSLITLTQVPLDANGAPIVGGTPISVIIGGPTVVGANAVFFGQTADVGFGITRAALTNPNGQGQNRYDDLAFIVSAVAVPEPTTMCLIACVCGFALIRFRRRQANWSFVQNAGL